MTEEKKVAIVTGGSRGLGAAEVVRMAELGYDVAFNYVNPAKKPQAEEVAAKVQQLGRKAYFAVADGSNEDQVNAFVKDVAANLGDNIEVLVNNAGIDHGKLFVDSDIALMRRVIDVNLMGPIIMTKAVLPYMMARKTGCIIYTSSSSTTGPTPMESVYAATKSALSGLVKSLTPELAPYGIRVNIILPGPFNTDMVKEAAEELREGIAESLPAGRIGDPSELAHLVGEIVQNQYLWGGTYIADGGQHC